jgi:hypothetical protein
MAMASDYGSSDNGYSKLADLILKENPYVDTADPDYVKAVQMGIDQIVTVLTDLRNKMSTLAPSAPPQDRAARRSEVAGYRKIVDGPAAENSSRYPVQKPSQPMPFFEVHERIMAGLFWHFGGTPHRISKAFRIPYRLKGDPEEYNIFIGYGGCGGW